MKERVADLIFAERVGKCNDKHKRINNKNFDTYGTVEYILSSVGTFMQDTTFIVILHLGDCFLVPVELV